MHIYRSLAELPRDWRRTVVAIGNFDGVHRGHREILGELRARARAAEAVAVAITFDPHPMRLLRPQQAPRLITPMPQRLQLLAETGIDATLVLPFTQAFAALSASEFGRQVLSSALRAVEVHEGDNFRFGQGASAGVTELQALGQELGFRVIVHPAMHMRGLIVSSSQIRQLIADGNLSAARSLLGRPFSIQSSPARGRGIGSRLTVPTINLAPYGELLPAGGVYVTRLAVGQGKECRVFDAVTNAGVRPTFGEESFAVESHLLDFDPQREPLDLEPGTPLELCFLARLRAERRFESPEALREQILRDAGRALRMFKALRRAAPQHRNSALPSAGQLI